MKRKIKNVTYACVAALVLVLIPIFMAKDKPIQVNLHTLKEEEVSVQEEKKQKAAHVSAAQVIRRRIYQCQADEDCIIVEKDPCGCWVGPSGVTAINASRTFEFNQMYTQAVTKTCPEGEPSVVRECSPSAHPVCRENLCKIEY